jgi:hypothetical protein
MYADAISMGAVRITGKQVRAMSNEPTPSPSSPGLNIKQLMAVAKKLHIPLYDRTGLSFDSMIGLIGGGRRALAQVSYLELGQHRCQSGDFGHMILLQAINHDEVLGNDPLCSAARWYPIPVVEKAMRKFAQETSQSGVRFAVSPIIPKIAR